MYHKNKYNKACRRNGMHCSLPTAQTSSFVIVVSIANSDNDLCHNHQMLWHIWKVPIDVPCCQCNMTLRWQVLIRLLWLATWHRGIVFVWLVCRQWQLCWALSVETRYGGVCDLLVALTTHSLPRHHCLLLLLLLWTATVACGAIFVEAGVIIVCRGGCPRSDDGCRWWLSVATLTLLMMGGKRLLC